MKYEPLTEDAYFHIYNQGNNRENLFIENENYAYFLKLFERHTSSVCQLVCYCLLKNHFHLLIKTRVGVQSKNISQSFSNFFNAYSKSINKKYNRTGSLFKDRFSRIQLRDEIYLKNLIIYIHLNPLKHGFMNDFKNYSYSSYASIISRKPTKLLRELVLELFDGARNFEHVHNSKQIDLSEEYALE